MLVDSHCHLSFEVLGNYSNATLELLNKAKELGITLVLDVILKQNLLEKALNFSKTNPMVYNAFGVHPCDIDSEINSLLSFNNLINIIKSNNKLVAIGETGLDYFYSQENKTNQMISFETHCKVAHTLKKPIIVHTRNATLDTLTILKNFTNKHDLTGVIHCFTGNIETAKKYLDLGFYISFSGIVTFKKSTEIQEVAKYVPNNKILLETDSPYLAPVPYRGKSNQPSYIYNIAEYIAYLKNFEIQKLAEYTTNNFKVLFKIDKVNI